MRPIFHSAQPVWGHFSESSQQVAFSNLRRHLFAESVDFEFSQRISLVYEVGTNSVCRVGGPARGRAEISQMFGPSADLREFNSRLGQIESPNNIVLKRGDSQDSESVDRRRVRPDAMRRISIKDAVITQVGASAGSSLISAQVGTELVFGDLEVKT